MNLTFKPIRTKTNLHEFIHFPWTIYSSDRNWVPPLLTDRYAKVDIEKNPFWHSAERELWLAEKDGKPAGTIAAIINHQRNEKLKDGVGMFGFFESKRAGVPTRCMPPSASKPRRKARAPG